MDKYDFPYRPDMRPRALPLAASEPPAAPAGRRCDNLVAGFIFAAWSVPAALAIAAFEFRAMASPPHPNLQAKPVFTRDTTIDCDQSIGAEFIRIQDAMDEKLRAERGLQSK